MDIGEFKNERCAAEEDIKKYIQSRIDAFMKDSDLRVKSIYIDVSGLNFIRDVEIKIEV